MFVLGPAFDLIWLCIERQQRYIIAQWGLCVYQAGPSALLAIMVGKGAPPWSSCNAKRIAAIAERWGLLALNAIKQKKVDRWNGTEMLMLT